MDFHTIKSSALRIYIAELQSALDSRTAPEYYARRYGAAWVMPLVTDLERAESVLASRRPVR